MAGKFMRSMIKASSPEEVLSYAKGKEKEPLGKLIEGSAKDPETGDYITDIEDAVKGAGKQLESNISGGIDKIKRTGQKLYNTGMRIGKAISQENELCPAQ